MMAVTSAAGMRLESRAAQTSAICSSDFTWAENSKQASPCQQAASVDALCNNGSESRFLINLYPKFMFRADWLIGALNSTVQYTNPSGPVASVCTWYVTLIVERKYFLNEIGSSWASYNLISACIACQGFPEQTPAYVDFTTRNHHDLIFVEKMDGLFFWMR